MKKLTLIAVLIFALGLVFSGFALADDFDEGCSPGYWKNLKKHEDSWVRVSPDDDFGEIFRVSVNDLTLI